MDVLFLLNTPSEKSQQFNSS